MTATVGVATTLATGAGGNGEASAPSRRRRGVKRRLGAYLLLLVPLTAIVGVFMGYPLYQSVYQSLHTVNNTTGVTSFAGLENYRAFFHDHSAWSLIFHSYLRGFGGVIPSYVLGLIAALALHQKTRLNKTSRVLVLMPLVIFGPVAVNIWRQLIDPQTGLPSMLGWHVDLLNGPHLVWPTLIVINTWGSYQFYTMILLAALSRIPSELHEAAAIDGAGTLARFRWVTLPGIAGISVIACTIHFILSFQEFNLIYLLTGGGPLGRTQTLATFSYSEAFSYNKLGYASAITLIGAIITVLTLAVIAALFFVGRRALRNVPVARLIGVEAMSMRFRRRRTARKAGRADRPRRHIRAVYGHGGWGAYTTIIVLVVVALGPMLLMLSRSFDISPESAISPTFWPRHFSLSNYHTVIADPGLRGSSATETPALFKNAINSVIVAVAVTILVVVVAMMGGYALSRWRSKITRGAVGTLLGLQLVPAILWVFPLYALLIDLHLLDTKTGQILATSILFLPIGALFFRSFFDEIPRELDEAAAVDGAGPIRILWSILRPMARPIVGAVGAFTIVNSWNEYLFATTFVQSDPSRTLPPILQEFMSSLPFNATLPPGVQAVFFILPILAAAILLAITQRQLAAAYQGGALKG